MSRFPSNRLRVEFDGPDVSQEMLYTLFRVGLAYLDCPLLETITDSSAIRSPIGYPTSHTCSRRLPPVR
jgi:hypothetical protein